MTMRIAYHTVLMASIFGLHHTTVPMAAEQIELGRRLITRPCRFVKHLTPVLVDISSPIRSLGLIGGPVFR